MYHTPRMCRTCLQMSRGDFKFVSLESVDPLWESSSPNLKEQLISLVPEMKIENSGAYICTSCFIALRTAYEFKRMCQATEQKFQSHNYKYRRPFGVGPGSAQFHVTLNENCKSSEDDVDFRCQNLNYLQADTSIDITEHHLYDANKTLPRKQLNYINNVTQKLPEIDVEVIMPEKQPSPVPAPAPAATAAVAEKTPEAVPPKKLDSLALRKKYNIGSEISILKTENKNNPSTLALVKLSCEEIPFLKENRINPDALNCYIRIQLLTQDFVKISTCGKYSLDEIKEISNSYYFDNLDDLLPCQFCTKTFSTRHALQMHEDEHAVDKFFNCSHCNMQFLINSSLEQHLKIEHNLTLPPIANPSESTDEVKPPDLTPANKEIVEPPIMKDEDETKTPETPKEDETKKNEVGKEDVEDSSKINELKLEVLPEKPKIVEAKPEKCSNTQLDVLNDDKKFDAAAFSEQLSNSIKKHIEEPPAKPNDEPLETSTPIKKKSVNEFKMLKKKYKTLFKHRLELRSPIIYYKCWVCNKICRNKVQLYQHCKFIHIPNVSINTVLKEELKEETNTRHMVTRSSNRTDIITPYKCNICDKNFSEENFLNLHMYVHTPTILSSENVTMTSDDGPEIFTCYLCNKGFTKERYLKLHNLHVHLCKTTTCKICNRVFKSEFWFSRHRCQLPVEVPEVVPDERQCYPCNFCNRTFAALRFMKSHRKRMHYDLINRGPARNKPKYLTSRNSSEALEIGDLELDDPMKLYTISGSSAFEDEEDVIEILSDSERYSDESGEESEMHGAQEDEEEEEVNEDVFAQNEPEIPKNFEEFTNTSNTITASVIDEVIIPPNPSPVNVRRKSVTTRSSTPKIQCDFCGEFIEENCYDNHIYEHNKLRLQKGSSSRKSEINSDSLEATLEKNKIILKCHICFRAFQRKYHLVNHVNRHLNGELNTSVSRPQSEYDENETKSDNEVEEEETEHFANENETVEEHSLEDSLNIANNSDVFECCGRTFKMKAHFFRHYTIKHGSSGVVKPKPTTPSVEKPQISPKPKIIQNEETNENVSNRSRYNTRHSNQHLETPNKQQEIPEEQQESPDKKQEIPDIKQETPKIQQETIEKDDKVNEDEKSLSEVALLTTFNSLNKRKSETIEEPIKEDVPVKKRRTAETQEVAKRKRAKSESDTTVLSKKRVSTTPVPPEEIEIEVSPIATNLLLLKYECHLCDKKFKQKCQLRDHLNVHTGAKPYICEFCIPNRGFTQTSSLYVHYRRVHAIIMKNCQWEVYSKNGACLICSEVFEKHAVMFQHMKEQYTEKAYQCHVCMDEFSLICHFKVHDIDPEKMRSIVAPDTINNILSNNSNAVENPDNLLTANVNSVENADNLLTGNVEKNKPKIRRRRTKTSVGSSTPTSSLTEETCESEPDSMGKNGDPETLKCVACNKTFTDKQQLRFHKKSLAHFQHVQLIKKQMNTKKAEEAGEPPNTIEDIQNSVKAIMEKISVIRNNKKHRCPVCDMRFVKKMQLRKHKRKMHRVVRPRVKKASPKPSDLELSNQIDETSEQVEQDVTTTDDINVDPSEFSIKSIDSSNASSTTIIQNQSSKGVTDEINVDPSEFLESIKSIDNSDPSSTTISQNESLKPVTDEINVDPPEFLESIKSGDSSDPSSTTISQNESSKAATDDINIEPPKILESIKAIDSLDPSNATLGQKESSEADSTITENEIVSKEDESLKDVSNSDMSPGTEHEITSCGIQKNISGPSSSKHCEEIEKLGKATTPDHDEGQKNTSEIVKNPQDVSTNPTSGLSASADFENSQSSNLSLEPAHSEASQNKGDSVELEPEPSTKPDLEDYNSIETEHTAASNDSSQSENQKESLGLEACVDYDSLEIEHKGASSNDSLPYGTEKKSLEMECISPSTEASIDHNSDSSKGSSNQNEPSLGQNSASTVFGLSVPSEPLERLTSNYSKETLEMDMNFEQASLDMDSNFDSAGGTFDFEKDAFSSDNLECPKDEESHRSNDCVFEYPKNFSGIGKESLEASSNVNLESVKTSSGPSEGV